MSFPHKKARSLPHTLSVLSRSIKRSQCASALFRSHFLHILSVPRNCRQSIHAGNEQHCAHSTTRQLTCGCGTVDQCSNRDGRVFRGSVGSTAPIYDTDDLEQPANMQSRVHAQGAQLRQQAGYENNQESAAIDAHWITSLQCRSDQPEQEADRLLHRPLRPRHLPVQLEQRQSS